MNTDDNNGVIAWLLQVDRLVNVAIGQFELIHIIDKPDYMSIPQAPKYCNDVILWNSNIVPVMSLASWLTSEIQLDSTGVVAIVVYEDNQGKYKFGGIKLSNAPVQAKVTNGQQCQLTGEYDKWRKVSLSSFKSKAGDIVPILDVSKLFSQILLN